jgi:outer membrane protein
MLCRQSRTAILEVKVIRVLMIVLMLGVVSPAFGQALKVGFVNIQKAISESRAGERARKKFEGTIKAKEAALAREKQTIERLKRDLEKKALLLKADERVSLQRDFQKRVRDYERQMNDAQEELQIQERQMTAEILQDLQKIVEEIGKSQRFTLILDRSQLLYTDKGIDITNEVIQLYNRRLGKAR